MKRLRIREEARVELLHEVNFYEGKRIGIGKRFREAVTASFALIVRYPGTGAPAPANTRKTKVKGFPFTIVYREEQEQIVVFAIAPDRRQPGYWLSRTDDG